MERSYRARRFRSPMTSRRDYYRILHVQPDAPEEIIRASYRALMRDLKAHPDLGGDGAIAQEINAAYATLCDPLRRDEYDRMVASDSRQGQISKAAFAKLRDLQHAFAAFLGTESDDTLPAQTSAKERRAMARLEKKGVIEYLCETGGDPRTAQLRDVSPRGLGFTTGEALEIGQVIEVRAEFLRGRARVRSCRPNPGCDSDRYIIGVELVSVSFTAARGTFLSRTA